jgi:hypothetical protein
MTKRTSLLVVLTATVALAAAAFLMTRAQPSGAAGSVPASTATDQPVDPHGVFAVFRRAARSGDVMPPAVRKMFAPIAEREALDLGGARAVAPSGAGSVWAVPGRSSICLAIPDPVDGFAVSCNDTAAAQDGRLWVGLTALPGQDSGDVRAAILVPDGIETVTAVGGKGQRRSLGVSGNVAVADLSDSARLEFTDGDGKHGVNAPGTPDTLAAG